MKTNFTLKTLLLFFLGCNFLLLTAQVPPSNTRFLNPTGTTGNFKNSFVKHLNSNKDEFFYSTVTSGTTEYLGTTLVPPMNESRMISRIGNTALPIWTAQFYPASGDTDQIANDFACVDINDNLYIICNTKSPVSTFKDASGAITTFSNPSSKLQKILVKIDKDGNKLWAKTFDTTGNNYATVSLTTDAAGNLYIAGMGNGFSFEGVALSGTFIFKMNGTTGNVLYSKVYPDLQSYITKPVLDNSGNLFIFSEPLGNITPYLLDGITIPSNDDHLDNLMLKFDASGTCIFGKNFSETAPTGYAYESWITDVVFDGTDFIAIGDYSSSSSTPNFLKLSGTTFPKHYPGTQYEGFLAKISTNGTVLWEKALESFNSGQSVYTNIDLDANKNIYGYLKFRGDLYYEGNTYSFNSTVGDKVVIKFDNNGALLYKDIVDQDYLTGAMIDVFSVDKYNILGLGKQANFQGYPVTNTQTLKGYVATFGDLDGIYLSPINNYSEINTAAIANDPLPATNQFSFNLINNVNWSATSDQSWLNLSYLQLAGKNTLQPTVTGKGDAKITLTADANSTGLDRTANVMISGDSGAASKTVAVTQTGILATGETKTFTTTIYPNPTSDILNIESKQKISKIEIFDLTGKLLKTTNGQAKSISVSNLSKGMYLIKLYTENGVVVSKFMKK